MLYTLKGADERAILHWEALRPLGALMDQCGAIFFGKRSALTLGCAASLLFTPDARWQHPGGPPAGNRAAAAPARLIQLAWRWCLTWCEQLCRAPISLSFAESVVDTLADAWVCGCCFWSVNRSGDTPFIIIASCARSWSSHPALQASSSLVPLQTALWTTIQKRGRSRDWGSSGRVPRTP